MKRRPWSEADLAIIRRDYARVGRKALAQQLGRSEFSVKTIAYREGLAHRRSWTEDEKNQLIALLAEGCTAHAAARRIGRSPAQAAKLATRFGFAPQTRLVFTPARGELVRQRNAAGYSDAEIAAEIGCERHTVHDWRKRLGLAPAGNSARRRARVAEKTRAQLDRAGLPTIGHLRREAFRRWAVAQGWPADTPPRGVQILNAIWARGPMTRRELSDALGLPWKGSRKSLSATRLPGGSYLAVLMRAGLVVSLGRAVSGFGKGKNRTLYSLAEGVQRGPVDPSVDAPLIARGIRKHAQFHKTEAPA